MGMYVIESHELSQYMRLDASAVRALNLIESSEGIIIYLYKFGILFIKKLNVFNNTIFW